MSNRVKQRLPERRFRVLDTMPEHPESTPPFSYTTTEYNYAAIDCVSARRRHAGDRATTVLDGVPYYGYRYYNPGLGRWISRDPIGERGGLNLYMALYNNAMDLVDGLGKETIPWYTIGTWQWWGQEEEEKYPDYDLGEKKKGKCSEEGEENIYLKKGIFKDKWDNTHETINKQIEHNGLERPYRIHVATRTRLEHFKKYTQICECICYEKDGKAKKICNWSIPSGFEDVFIPVYKKTTKDHWLIIFDEPPPVRFVTPPDDDGTTLITV